MEGVEQLHSSWYQGQGKGQITPPPGWSRTHQPGLLSQLPGGAVLLSLGAELPKAPCAAPH